MEILHKPDWIPLRIQRVKGSKIWFEPGVKAGLPDYQFGWFWHGVINLADSDTPGYVLVAGEGAVELWKFFGAKSQDYFRKWGGNEFSERHFPKTEDGTRRYNRQLLEILRVQGKKLKRRQSQEDSTSLSSLSLSVIDFDLLEKAIEELFVFYAELFERDGRYKLTKPRRKKCAARICEHIKANGIDLDAAVEAAKEAMRNLKASEFHWTNGYYDWTDHLFKSRECFEKRLTARPTNGQAQPNRKLAATDAAFERVFGSAANQAAEGVHSSELGRRSDSGGVQARAHGASK